MDNEKTTTLPRTSTDALLLGLAFSLFAGSIHAQSLYTVSQCCGLGFAVDSLADINDDDINDLAVGANAEGTVYVYSGADGGLIHSLSANGSDLGYSVADAGDIDGDGTTDILAGGPTGGSGVAQVFSGRTGQLLLDLNPPDGVVRFGTAVAPMQDFNGDGQNDIVVGATGSSRAAIIFSGSDGAELARVSGGPRFGDGVASLDDVTGDGRPELMVSQTNVAVFVYASEDLSILYELRPDSATNSAYGEAFLFDVGDTNRDGQADIYVGAYNDDQGRGAVYLYSGADGALIRKLSGEPGDGLGPGAGAGDVDGDGHTDLVVGSYSHTAGTLSQAGKVTVFSGADGSVLASFVGQRTGGQFGFDAASLGDIDGDGRFDFLIGSSPANTIDVVAGTVDRRDPPVPPVDGTNADISFNNSGAWFEPATAGQGFLISVDESQASIFLAWFTYGSADPALGLMGSGEQHRWLTAQGTYVNNLASLIISRTDGGLFDNSQAVSTVPVGTMELRFSDCNNGVISYELDSNAIVSAADNGESPTLFGDIELLRIGTPLDC